MISHPNFIQNKYFKLYLAIIDNRIKNPVDLTVYSENHHILPKAMGGTKAKANMVRLYPREHYVAHKLLAKCTTGRTYFQMLRAVTTFSYNKIRNIKFTSRDYENLKIFYAIATSERHKGKKRSLKSNEKNRIAQTGKKCSIESSEKKRIAMTGRKNSEEHNKRISKGRLGLKNSPEQNKQHSLRLTGVKLSDKCKKNMSITRTGLSQNIISCPHCGMHGGHQAMSRYHLDKCKYCPDKINELLIKTEEMYTTKPTEKNQLELSKIRSIIVFQQLITFFNN